MTEDLTAKTEAGFQISDEPVIEARRGEGESAGSVGEWSGGLADDSLYILARDPQSLFVYWTLDWEPRFAAAGLGETQRQVQLRVLREDETEEATAPIDPLAGFAFVNVSSPGANYTCELGCFEGTEWKSLARSSATQTPLATLSEDLSADFATLPFHLSFQRLVDIFRSGPNGKGTKLAASVGDLQGKARALQASMSSVDWSKLVEAASSLVDAENGLGLPGVERDDIATLLRTVKEDTTRTLPSPEKLEEWRRLGERSGGSSWGGESSPDNGERWGGPSSLGGSSH